MFLIALALTDGALAILHRFLARPPRLLEASVLALANVAASLTRYVALAGWVFRARPAQPV